MTKLTSFTSSNIDPVQRDIRAALKSVEEKHGITIGFGRITWDQGQYTTKMSVAVGDAEQAAKAEFEKYCFKFNVSKEAFGTTFMANGEQYTICGIKPKAKTMPILAKNPAGKIYKFSADFLDKKYRIGSFGLR